MKTHNLDIKNNIQISLNAYLWFHYGELLYGFNYDFTRNTKIIIEQISTAIIDEPPRSLTNIHNMEIT